MRVYPLVNVMVHMLLWWLIGTECMNWYRKTRKDTGKSVDISGKNPAFEAKTSSILD